MYSNRKTGRKRILSDKHCIGCDKTFRPKSSLSKFCNMVCSYKYRPKKGLNKKCQYCKNIFYVAQSGTLRKYCSKLCANKGLYKSEPKKCVTCGMEFRRPPSQEYYRGIGKYCSKKCKGKAQAIRYQKLRSESGKYPVKLSKFKKWTWKHFSDFIRERDNWTCFTCGKYERGPRMHAGHFISRVRSSTMFDERNVHAQCYSCNIGKKGNAGEYAYRIVKIYGQEVLDELVQKSRETHRFTSQELEIIYQRSKTELKKLRELS